MHPDEGGAGLVPQFDFVGQHGAVAVDEAQVLACILALGIVEIGAGQGHQYRRVVECFRPGVVVETEGLSVLPVAVIPVAVRIKEATFGQRVAVVHRDGLGEHIAPGLFGKAQAACLGFDFSETDLQFPVAAKLGGAGQVGAGCDIGAGHVRQGFDQAQPVGACREITAIQQDIRLG